jgi:hypothetical protein
MVAFAGHAHAAGRCHINHQCMGPDDKTMIVCPDEAKAEKKCAQEEDRHDQALRSMPKQQCLDYLHRHHMAADGEGAAWCDQKIPRDRNEHGCHYEGSAEDFACGSGK